MFKNATNVVTTSLIYFRNTIFIVSVFITIFYLFAYFMNKDKIKITETRYEKSRTEIYALINNTEYQKTDFGKLQVVLYRSFLCTTLGETCTNNPDEAAPYIKESFVNKATNVLVSPYANPPASGILWAYEGAQNAGFIPTTYAQGIGFYALQPLAPVWKIFRNVAYMILVLIVVSIGFMIMFRASISAQAVITIENAIPRIVFAILLITFSFPIAGFMIDLMYLLMGLGGSVIIQNIAATTDGVDVAEQIGWGADIYNSTGWGLFSRVVINGNIWKTGSAILSLVPFELQLTLRTVIGVVVFGVLSLNSTVNSFVTGNILREVPFFGGALASGFGAVATFILFGLIAGVFFPIILSAFVYVTTLFLFFRIFLLLFMTYTKILLSVIFSPIILLFEAFPERNTFSYWIKGLFFNLLTFPVVAILLMTASMVINVGSTENWWADRGDDNLYMNPSDVNLNPNSGSSELWRPPFLYSVEPEGFVMLVGISIIFLIPDMIAFIKKSFGVEDLPFNITPGKLLGGIGVTAAGGLGLAARSRSLLSEFGVFREQPSTGAFGRIRDLFVPENPHNAIREALQNRSSGS